MCLCSISSFLRYFSTPSKTSYILVRITQTCMLRSFAYFTHAWRWLFFRVCVQMRLKLCIDEETFSIWVMHSVHSLFSMVPDFDGSSLLQCPDTFKKTVPHFYIISSQFCLAPGHGNNSPVQVIGILFRGNQMTSCLTFLRQSLQLFLKKEKEKCSTEGLIGASSSVPFQFALGNFL